MIYICIPVFNRIEYTRKCIRSIQQQPYLKYSIIICDDGSSDGTPAIIASEFPGVKLLKGSGNLWWSGATNMCVEYALNEAGSDDFIFTLNNDTEIAPDTFTELMNVSERYPDTIIACGNYFNTDHYRLEATAFVERAKWPFSRYHRLLFPWGQDVRELKERIYEVSSVSGKGVLIPAGVFRKVGLYNAEKLPQYHGDTEFTRRANNGGFRILLDLNAIIYTDQSASGIGQVNSRVSLREFIVSFRSLRSENYLPSLYNRARLIYNRKWLVYLIFNILSIWMRFTGRYFTSLKSKIFKQK